MIVKKLENWSQRMKYLAVYFKKEVEMRFHKLSFG